MPGRLLNSWKEISRYVGRGVRTVQRWEKELGFPVRRPRGHERSAVIAFTDEIDQWLAAAKLRREGRNQRVQRIPIHTLEQNRALLAQRTVFLADNLQAVQQQLARAIQLGAQFARKTRNT
jgi:hypothetical protein